MMSDGVNSRSKDGSAAQPAESEVLSQLERLADNPHFDTSQRSFLFLRYVVTQTLAGREKEISQSSIARCVFGRGDEFDPGTDPIVRIQAGRVRRSLANYYLTEGVDDTLRIELPKGGYIPRFSYREPEKSGSGAGPLVSWPTLLIKPFQNLTGEPGADYLQYGLASDLAVELSRYSAMQVYLATQPPCAVEHRSDARFQVTGNIQARSGSLSVTIHLLNASSGRLEWSHNYRCPGGVDDGELGRAVQQAAAIIAEENGVLTNRLRRVKGALSAGGGDGYRAILLHHHFEITQSPADFAAALQALRDATAANPGCALCWSYLARLCVIHWSLGMPGEDIPYSDALAAARRGVQLDPREVSTRLVLGYVYILNDELEAARLELDLARKINGDSIYWLDAIGYLLTLTGDYIDGPELIRKAVAMNPYHRPACHAALWLDALQRADPEGALAEARAFAQPKLFWRPLMEAVALVACNRREEATVVVKTLLECKPDFPERGRWLIARYVKSSEQIAAITRALHSTGLILSQ